MFEIIKIPLLFAFITAATAERTCKGLRFSNRYYDINIIKDGINKLHQLVLNRNDNTLYFTFDQIGGLPARSLAYFNLDSRQSGLIDGIRNASSIAIDHDYNTVYVGGAEGIFRLNNRKIPEHIPVHDDIRSMYFKDGLFYTNSRRQALVYDNGFINPMFELQDVDVDQFILDDDNNIFFTNGKNLFRVKVGTRAVNTHERVTVDVLTADSYGRAYVCTRDGVFVYNKYKYVLDKVADLRNLKALAFDKADAPVYGVADVIVQLQLNAKGCIEPERF